MKAPIVVRNLEYERLLNEEMEDERIMVRQLKVQLEAGQTREKDAILNLQKEGLSVSKIASVLNISESEVSSYLSKE